MGKKDRRPFCPKAYHRTNNTAQTVRAVCVVAFTIAGPYEKDDLPSEVVIRNATPAKNHAKRLATAARMRATLTSGPPEPLHIHGYGLTCPECQTYTTYPKLMRDSSPV